MKIKIDESKFGLIMFSVIVIPFVILIEAILIWVLSLVGFFIGGLLFLIINGLLIGGAIISLRDEGVIEFTRKDDR